MNYRNPLIVLAASLLLGLYSSATVAANEVAEAEMQAQLKAQQSASKAEEVAMQARLETEYKKALAEADRERHAAEASIERAREQLLLVSEQRQEATAQSTRARAEQQAKMEKVHEELNYARRQLRETSREISRVNREVARARADQHAASFVFRTSTRPIIGVILGKADDVGVKVLGVSPDGPAERAGIQQGDVIVALGGLVLAAVAETGDAKDGLNIAMQEIKKDEPIIVSVERGDQTLDLTVVPEVREPLTWQSITRFPSVLREPGSPHESRIIIERIEVPEIDTEAISAQIDQMRLQIDERRALMEVARIHPMEGQFQFEFHELSEMGDFALHDANVWFGLPMAQGLQLAEIDPGLGEYFKTDRGVLVLKAKNDNDLQLKSGDVILQVGDTEVNSPAEFMRALRGFHAGDEFEIDIKRKRKDRTLKTVMPKKWTSFFSPQDEISHTIQFTTTFN